MVWLAAFAHPACRSPGHSLPRSAPDFSIAPDFLSDQKELVEPLGAKILAVVGGASATGDLYGHSATGGCAAYRARALQRLAEVVGKQDRKPGLLDSERGDHRSPLAGYRRPCSLWPQVQVSGPRHQTERTERA